MCLYFVNLYDLRYNYGETYNNFPSRSLRPGFEIWGHVKSGQVYGGIWNLQAQKSGQILQVLFSEIFPRGFSESFMIDCDRISKWEALPLRNFNKKTKKFFFFFV